MRDDRRFFLYHRIAHFCKHRYSDLFILFCYFGLYRAGRSERISRIYICLSIAYACLAASQLCILLRIYGFAFLALPEDFFYISWIFILWQGVRFFGSTNRFNPLSLTVPALLALWAVMSHVLAIPLPWSSIPLCFTASGIFLLSCLYLWRNYRENRNIGLAIGAFMFLLCSLNTAGYPFLRNIAWYNPYGFTIAMILSLAIGMGLMLAILHEERLKLV